MTSKIFFLILALAAILFSGAETLCTLWSNELRSILIILPADETRLFYRYQSGRGQNLLQCASKV